MTASERMSQIKEMVDDYWFSDNPNTQEINTEIVWLIERIETLEKRNERLRVALQFSHCNCHVVKKCVRCKALEDEGSEE